MKREYAEAYVRWADTNVIDLDMLTGMGVVYAVFAFPLLVAALVVRQVVFPYIYIVLFLGHCILTAALKQKYCEFTYFQKFLNIGASGSFARLMFLLISLSLIEVTGIYGPSAIFSVFGVWLFLNVLDFAVVWWRIRSGRFYVAQERRKEQEKQKKTQRKGMRRGPAMAIYGIGGLAGILGMGFAKTFFSHAGQEVVVKFGVCLFIFIGMLLGIAGSNLWKAYYVKKYDIQGKSIPAYTPKPGQKQTVLHSILRTLGILGRILLGIIAFSVLATVVVYLFMKWLPAWLGHR